MKLPTLGEGWTWHITKPNTRCTNTKCCAPNSPGHPQIRIELRLHNQMQRHGTIDVQMYGAGRAVPERAQAMLDSVTAEQLRSVGST